MAGLKQPRNERGHNGIGEIRDDLPGPLPQEGAEVEVPGIPPDERDVPLALEEGLQDLKEPWIDLDRDDPVTALGQGASQRPNPRPDLQDPITSLKLRPV